MNEKLEFILKTKAYSELTSEELQEFKGLCNSREEYENLQLFFSQLDSYTAKQEFDTHYMTKGSLDEIFEKKYKKPGLLVKLFPTNKPLYLTPIIQIAAIVVAVFLIFQFTDDDTENEQQLAQVEQDQVKKKPQVEKKALAPADESTSDEKPTNQSQISTEYRRIKESPNTDNKSDFTNSNIETTSLSASATEPYRSANSSTVGYEDMYSSASGYKNEPSFAASIPATSSEKSIQQNTSRHLEEDSMEDLKVPTYKKSSTSLQPKLFDLLTAVY